MPVRWAGDRCSWLRIATKIEIFLTLFQMRSFGKSKLVGVRAEREFYPERKKRLGGENDPDRKREREREPSVLPGYDDDEMSRLVTKRCAGTAAGAGLPSVHPRGANFGLARTATTTTTTGVVAGEGAASCRRSVVAMAVKKWIKPDVNESTGKAVRTEMHVREGDTVKVISGKDKGKVGEVVKVYRKGLKAGRILVDDVNLVKKALKPKTTMGGEEERGKVILTEAPIHHSNVMLYSKTKQVVSRVGHKVENGKKLRYLVKTGEVLAEVPRKTRPAKDEGEGEGDTKEE